MATRRLLYGLGLLSVLAAAATPATANEPHAAGGAPAHGAPAPHAAPPASAHGAEAEPALAEHHGPVPPVPAVSPHRPDPFTSASEPEALRFAAGDTSLAAGWERWFAALESTVVERSAAGRGEAVPLYPLDRSAPAVESGSRPYRHLAIAKAVGQLETGAAAEGKGVPGGAGSPLLALANARNYLNLSEYDKALEWYGRAAAYDGTGNFRRETGREALAAAICARDTAAAGRAVAGVLALADIAEHTDEVVLAFRWLLNRNDRDSLTWLLQRTAEPGLAQEPRLGFWRAYALSALDRRDDALAQLRELLAAGSEGRALNERERGWVLTATADLLLLQGAAGEAAALYERLAAAEVPALSRWGRLQSAGLAFVGHRYADASAGYREICQTDRDGHWGAHACAMADIAAQLDRLMSKGEQHGAHADPRQ